MRPLVDTHIHLDAPELQGAGENRLPEAGRSGIGAFVIPGVRVSGWQQLLRLSERQAGVYAAPGLHPAYAAQWSYAVEQQLRDFTAHPKVVAIGEIGLDGVVGPLLELQEQVLRAQLQIALEKKLPVLLHARKTTGRLLAILRELEIGPLVGGVWHGFSGSLPVAQELVALGFKLGIGPILLRESARKLPQAVIALPAAAMVLETDFPDMAESPAVLIAVAEKVAELRGWTLPETVRITSKNACELFDFRC